MKKTLLGLLASACLAISAAAQTGWTPVTATVSAYAGGTVVANFVNQGGGAGQPMLNGSPIPTSIPSSLNSSGVFSFSVPSNALVSQQPSCWQFKITAGATRSPASYVSACIPVSGSSTVDLSTYFASAPGATGVTQIVAGSNITLSPTSGTGAVTVSSSGGTLANNLSVNQPSSSKFLIETDSLGQAFHGAFGDLLIQKLGFTGTVSQNNIGSASIADVFACNSFGASTGGCNPSTTYPFQRGAFPLTFPLGITSNTKVLYELGFNDLSNMLGGGGPNANMYSYFAGGYRAQLLMFGIPDSLKLTAASNCTTTGTWTAVTSIGSLTFPAGTLQTTTPGATMTCTGRYATNAGIIGYKSTTSTTASYTVSITNAGTTYNVADTYTGSTTLNQTAYYTTAWGASKNFYAVGKSGMSGGLTTITITAANNGSDPVVVVAPYFLSTSMSPQDFPVVNAVLSSRACGNGGACNTVAVRTDAQTNALRAAQVAVLSELRSSGLNINWFDPNAPTTGYNSSDPVQYNQVNQFTVTAGGSGYTTTPTITFTGCTVNPTATLKLTGSAVTTGTFYTTTSGACNGGTPVATITGGGGSGATATAAVVGDGVHPNDIGAANFAAVAVNGFNSAQMIRDQYQPSSGSLTAPISNTYALYDGAGGLKTSSMTEDVSGFAVFTGQEIAVANTTSGAANGFRWGAAGSDGFVLKLWATGNGAGLPNSLGLLNTTRGAFAWTWAGGANSPFCFFTPITAVSSCTNSPAKIDTNGSYTSLGFVATGVDLVPYSASPTFLVTKGNSRLVLTGSVTSSTLAAGTDGQRKCIDIIEDSTGGWNFVWPTNVVGGMGLNTAANKKNHQCFTFYNADSAWVAESLGVSI